MIPTHVGRRQICTGGSPLSAPASACAQSGLPIPDIDAVLHRLESVRRSGIQWSARCPAHFDAQNSLSVGEGEDGQVLLYCHAGCTIRKIVGALGLALRDLYIGAPRPSPRGARKRRRGAADPTHPTDPTWAGIARDCESAFAGTCLTELAQKLGVGEGSLRALTVGWSDRDRAWTFPEFDARGNVVGILRRYGDGTKRLMRGGHRGLCLPRNLATTADVIYVPEGPTDTAVLLDHGLQAVGRPSCTGGLTHLCDLFVGVEARVVVVGENDRKADGRWPGREGAVRIATALAAQNIKATWTLPPEMYKDVRDWLTSKGDYHA